MLLHSAPTCGETRRCRRAPFDCSQPDRISRMSDCCLNSIEVGTGTAARRIAVRLRQGDAPGLFWLGGFNSDMRGTKAEALVAWAEVRSRAMVRFDYSGHGESGGAFTDGTIGRWLE